MKYLLQKSRLQHLIQHRNGYLALASGSLLLNILLVITILVVSGHERIVMVPPTIDKSFWVTADHVSPEYLSEMSLFFADLRLNVTPSNAAMQRDVLLRYVNSGNYAALKSELLSESEHLTKSHLSTAFYPADIQVDAKKLISRITGDLQSKVGDSDLPVQHVLYEIHFSYHAGRLFVQSFEEIKHNA